MIVDVYKITGGPGRFFIVPANTNPESIETEAQFDIHPFKKSVDITQHGLIAARPEETVSSIERSGYYIQE